MDLREFLELTKEEVSQLVRAAGQKVCVFPINGTRRWFVLTHPLEEGEDLWSAYLDVAAKRHIEMYRLLFDHGLDTLLTPVFGPDLLERGAGYTRMAVEGLARLATHPDFLDFYDAYQVRVCFYGDYRRFLESTSHAHLSGLFDQVSDRTRGHEGCRLFFGAFAHDATERVAEIAVQFYREHGCPPKRHQIVEAYYGEYVEPVDLFIGFDRFAAFDMPLLATGSEDLYFTVSPSPYLSEPQLRDILYDHLYARRGEPDYSALGVEDWDRMRGFYQANLGRTQGVGTQRNGIWYPLPQVRVPDSLWGAPVESGAQSE